MPLEAIVRLMRKAGCTDKQIMMVTGLTKQGLKALG